MNEIESRSEPSASYTAPSKPSDWNIPAPLKHQIHRPRGNYTSHQSQYRNLSQNISDTYAKRFPDKKLNSYYDYRYPNYHPAKQFPSDKNIINEFHNSHYYQKDLGYFILT